jgi:outer membrane receptor protein involved in Fe transport
MSAILLVCGAAVPAGAQAMAQSFHLHIERQQLDGALKELAEQTGIQIARFSDTPGGTAMVGPLSGDMSVEQALVELLKRQGLTYKVVNEHMIAVTTAAPSASVQDSSGGFRVGAVDQAPSAAAAALSTGPERAADEDHVKLEEVVVTANKRSEQLLSVAAPVTALTGSELTRDAAVRLDDYSAAVPGLNLMSDRPGETQIILRGINTGSVVSSTVATYVDDIPYGSSTSFALGGILTPDLDPNDLTRIEVLRGPQGTLYGASSLGGLVKFVTTPPSLSEYSGHLQLDGSYVAGGEAGYGVRIMANAPLVADTLALRVSGYDRRDPGFISDPNLSRDHVNRSDIDGGHAQLLWRPAQSFSVELTALIQDLTGRGTSDEDVDVKPGSITPIYGDLKQVRYAQESLDVHYRLFGATLNGDLGWGTLTSITSYSTMHETQIYDQTTTLGPLLTELTGIADFGNGVGSDLHLGKVTEEVRLASATAGPLEWLGGFFFTHEHSDRDEPSFQFDSVTGVPFSIPTPLFFASLNSTYTEYAGFGDLTYHFTPKFDLMAGIRYGSNHQVFRELSTGLFAGGTTDQYGTSTDHSVTYLVTPRWKIDSNNMLYARVASGYRPGGPNSPTVTEVAAGVPSAYKPDKLTNYEIGYKSSWYDGALTLDLSAFHIDWKDIQIETEYSGLTSNGNGGTARSDGFEASLRWIPVRGLTLTANVAETKARLTQDAPGVNGKNGDELPNVPKWNASLNGDYDFPVTSDVRAFVGATTQYVDARESAFITGSPADFVRPVMPPYTTVNLRTGAAWKRWTVELYAKNVANVRGFNNLTSLALSGYSNPFTASLIQPRTIGLSIRTGF